MYLSGLCWVEKSIHLHIRIDASGKCDHVSGLQTRVSEINMRSIDSEKRYHEYSAGLMWMSATDITVD